MFATFLISTWFLSAFCAVPEWDYDGPNGVSQWATLYPEYCSNENTNQSPINIRFTFRNCGIRISAIVFNGYEKTLQNSRIVNNGRSIEIFPNEADSYTITGGCLDGATYRLENIHFHWGNASGRGSEHALYGWKGDMEAHFVHYNIIYNSLEEALSAGGVAVLAVLYTQIPRPLDSLFASPSITTITEAFNETRYADTEKTDFDLRYPVYSLLPSPGQRRFFFCYNGSLTTPNCNQPVKWTVFQIPKLITAAQIEEFRNLRKNKEGETDIPLVNNFRPIQPLNGRCIAYYPGF